MKELFYLAIVTHFELSQTCKIGKRENHREHALRITLSSGVKLLVTDVKHARCRSNSVRADTLMHNECNRCVTDARRKITTV